LRTSDLKSYNNFLRMDEVTFNELVQKVDPLTEGRHTVWDKTTILYYGTICVHFDGSWIWKRFWEGIAIGYRTGTGHYRPKLFVNPSRPNTNKSPHPLIL
jgi:hypothetical protein